MRHPSIIHRALLCPFGLCQTFRQNSDDSGVWGECQKCGRRSGFVDREALKAYADREVNQALAEQSILYRRDGYQRRPSGSETRPALPTGGSGVKPAPSDQRIVSILEDHVTRLQAEIGSWRRVAERLGAEKAAVEADLSDARHEIEKLYAELDPPVCRLQFPDGGGPGNAREAAEGWKREYDALYERYQKARPAFLMSERQKEEANAYGDEEHARAEAAETRIAQAVAILTKVNKSGLLPGCMMPDGAAPCDAFAEQDDAIRTALTSLQGLPTPSKAPPGSCTGGGGDGS